MRLGNQGLEERLDLLILPFLKSLHCNKMIVKKVFFIFSETSSLEKSKRECIGDIILCCETNVVSVVLKLCKTIINCFIIS